MIHNTLNSGVDLRGEHWLYCNSLTQVTDYLVGLTVIKGKALNRDEKDSYVKKISSSFTETTGTIWKINELYRPMKNVTVDLPEAGGSVDLELIPYYAWANRGLAYVDVWMPLAKKNPDILYK